MGKFKQLKWNDRLKIEKFLKEKRTVTFIAEEIGVSRQTIYNEIKRGEFEHLNSDLTTSIEYAADIAQAKADYNNSSKGTQLKIGNNYPFAEYIEHLMVDENYSPSAALAQAERDNKFEEYNISICFRTLYNYIDKGIFFRLSNSNLPVKGNKKRKYNPIKRQKRASVGTNIDKRPKSAEDREEAGHWEMDTVVGARGKSKNVLLVLSERKSRKEIIKKLPDKSSESVVEYLNELEHRYGTEKFKKIFKTITVDNGTEFSDFEGMQNSSFIKDKKTKIYYCHAYCSWERGTNENQNKLIRRHIPKGTNFDGMTDEQIQVIEDWINNYPRKIFGWRTANELFEESLDDMLIA